MAQAYNFDTGELGLADPLPAKFQADHNPLFIRLWQARVPFVAGQATALDDVSGLKVTVTLPALPSLIALRPFWRFAVRPSRPVLVYPQRYLLAPQPGPRKWIADLAMMAAGREGSTLLEDCRAIFPAEQGGQCCTLRLGPDDSRQTRRVAAVLDGLTARNSGELLLAGTYPLAAPPQARVPLAWCSSLRRRSLPAPAAGPRPFPVGLAPSRRCEHLHDARAHVQMPAVPISTQPGRSQISVSQGLTIEDCTLQAPVPPVQVSGMGLAISGRTTGPAVRRNKFLGRPYQPSSGVFGIMASSTADTVATSVDSAEISGRPRCLACRTGIYLADSNAATAQAARDGLAASTRSRQNAALATALNIGMQAPALATAAGTMARVVAGMEGPPAAPTNLRSRPSGAAPTSPPAASGLECSRWRNRHPDEYRGRH